MASFDSQKINVGIIGSGFAAYTHMLAFKHIPLAQVYAIAGGTRAASLSQLAGCKHLSTVEELLQLSELDAVIICSPHFLHESHTLQAFQQAKHVLVEKPMATDVQACQRMIASSVKAQRVLMVGHFQRYRLTNAAAKMAIADGRLGRVFFIQDTLFEQPSTKPWEQDARARGFLLGYGIHAIDRILWWQEGRKVRSVYGISQNPDNRSVECISSVILEFDDQSVASITTSNYGGLPRANSPGAAFFQATVIGSSGALSVDAYGKVLLRSSPGQETETLAELPQWSSLDALERLQAYIHQDKEFIDAICGKGLPSIDGWAGMRNVQVALAAYEASLTRQVVRLE
jgi:predicted dehydrogenase